MAMQLEICDGVPVFHGRSKTPTVEKNALLLPYDQMISNYGVVFRALPDRKQAAFLNQSIGNARFVRNHYLVDRIAAYQKKEAFPDDYLQQLKEAFPFLKLTDKFVCEAAMEHVDVAYKNFFEKRAKFPRFASKNKPSGNHYTTKFTNDNIRLCEDQKSHFPCIQLPKIGKVRIILPKGKSIQDYYEGNTRILKATIKRSGRIYTISLQFETIVSLIHPMQEVSRNRFMAVDLGLKKFGVFGNDSFTRIVENPRWIRLHKNRLRRFQQSLSRKQYDPKTHTGSKNREKAIWLVQKEQRKTANQRKDFHHKLSKWVADHCDAFVCEDLNVEGMVRNHHLAKSIADVGWGQFLTFVKYKLERKNGHFLKVSRWFASSQLCSCGYKNPAVKDLRIRNWTCPKCGVYHDRDINAMRNILEEGIRLAKENGISVFELAA